MAYFPDTLALYAGDRVQIMGVQVGQIDTIEPAGDKMKVTFHYDNKFKVPANATASILNPSLVASRNIQLSPPYTGGPVMVVNADISTTARRSGQYDTARLAQPDPDRPRPDQGTAQGPVRRHHRISGDRVGRQG